MARYPADLKKQEILSTGSPINGANVEIKSGIHGKLNRVACIMNIHFISFFWGVDLRPTSTKQHAGNQSVIDPGYKSLNDWALSGDIDYVTTFSHDGFSTWKKEKRQLLSIDAWLASL